MKVNFNCYFIIDFYNSNIFIGHIIATICSLLLNTTGNDLQRVLHKFTEENGAKIERLVDLFEKYNNKTIAVENNISLLRESRKQEFEEDDDDNFALLRLEAGLYTLQMTCVVICFIFVLSEKNTQEKIKSQISLQGGNINNVYQIVFGTESFLINLNIIHTTNLISRLCGRTRQRKRILCTSNESSG